MSEDNTIKFSVKKQMSGNDIYTMSDHRYCIGNTVAFWHRNTFVKGVITEWCKIKKQYRIDMSESMGNTAELWINEDDIWFAKWP